MPSSVGDKRVGLLAFVFSFVDPNFVWANEAAVNWGTTFSFETRVAGCAGLDNVELNRELDGDVDALADHPFDDVGDDGDNMTGDKHKLFREADKFSIGLKHCASGLNVRPAAWTSRSTVSVLSSFLSLYKILI